MAEQKIEISMDLDPVERLTKEIELSILPGAKRIGKFLLEQFEKDEVLKQCYFDRKVELSQIYGYVIHQAKERAEGRDSAMIEDEEVYGWVIHFVQDGPIAETNAEKIVVTKTVITEEEREKAKQEALKEFKEQEIKRLQEAEEKKRKEAAAKLKKKNEESGQIMLFDLGD